MAVSHSTLISSIASRRFEPFRAGVVQRPPHMMCHVRDVCRPAATWISDCDRRARSQIVYSLPALEIGGFPPGPGSLPYRLCVNYCVRKRYILVRHFRTIAVLRTQFGIRVCERWRMGVQKSRRETRIKSLLIPPLPPLPPWVKACVPVEQPVVYDSLNMDTRSLDFFADESSVTDWSALRPESSMYNDVCRQVSSRICVFRQ